MNRLFLFFFVFPTLLWAQQNSMSGKYIKGIVQHKVTREPVKNALVRLYYKNTPLESTATTHSGEFKIGICSCYADSLLTIRVDQESYISTQESFQPQTKDSFTIPLTYDYRSGTSKVAYKEWYSHAFYTKTATDIQLNAFYINCVGEIRQGKEIKQISSQNWELTTIGNFGQ